MTIRHAEDKDYSWLEENDVYISEEVLKMKIVSKEIYVMEEENILIGWLRYGLFWDNIPFMNMIYLLDGFRGKSNGKKLMQYWENEMVKQGYESLLTTSQSNEDAQHFYRSLGFIEIGGFKYLNDPYEIIFHKKINN